MGLAQKNQSTSTFSINSFSRHRLVSYLPLLFTDILESWVANNLVLVVRDGVPQLLQW